MIARRDSDGNIYDGGAEEAKANGGATPALSAKETGKREQGWQKIARRAKFGFAMIFLFLTIVSFGHMYVAMFVLAIQAALFYELVNVRYDATRELEIPLFRTTQWSWFIVAMFYTYGDWLRDFAGSKPALFWMLPVLNYHGLVTFLLFSSVLIGTIASLKRSLMRYQVSHLSWSIVSIVMIVGQLKCIAHNICAGLFWFMMPAAAVVANDTFAYVCGVALGRKIIKAPFLPTISPNKTWEGFLGALVTTSFFCVYFAGFLASFDVMRCPTDSLYFTPLLIDERTHYNCEDPGALSADERVSLFGLSLALPQAHGLGMALVASLIAPWGGFLASAIKRAYEIKDFGSIIPGHGGVMDRMDCQLIMMMATYVQFRTFHAPRFATWPVTTILARAALLEPAEQEVLLGRLAEMVRATAGGAGA